MALSIPKGRRNNFSSPSCAWAHPVMHEKSIAQSRDRQGADPLADARGSVHISIFEAVPHAPSAHPMAHENVILGPAVAMDEGRLTVIPLRSRSSLTWQPLRTHDCCRLYTYIRVEHAEQIVSIFRCLHRKLIAIDRSFSKEDAGI